MTTARSTIDAVGVFNQQLVQVFPRARIVRVVVDEHAKVMEHPLETGATITDHRIIIPTRIEIYTILQAADYLSTYRQIKQFFLNSTLLSVQTKATVYNNQLISEIPHEEDPEFYDALQVVIKFRQVLFAGMRASISPQNPADNSTVQRGQVETSYGGNSSNLNGQIPT